MSELLNDIREWNGLKHEIDKLQKLEYALRESIAKKLLDGKLEGSKTSVVEDTLKMQATAVINYRVDRAELDLIKDELSETEWAALNFRPEVKVAAFRKLENDSKLHDAITSSPGRYQLKIVEDLA